jgi:hypothetical protein
MQLPYEFPCDNGIRTGRIFLLRFPVEFGLANVLKTMFVTSFDIVVNAPLWCFPKGNPANRSNYCFVFEQWFNVNQSICNMESSCIQIILDFTKMFRTSFQTSQFTSRFVNKASDWLLNQPMQPIKCSVYKPICKFHELVNFSTNLWSSEHFSEK